MIKIIITKITKNNYQNSNNNNKKNLLHLSKNLCPQNVYKVLSRLLLSHIQSAQLVELNFQKYQTSRNVKRFFYQQVNPKIYV